MIADACVQSFLPTTMHSLDALTANQPKRTATANFMTVKTFLLCMD